MTAPAQPPRNFLPYSRSAVSATPSSAPTAQRCQSTYCDDGFAWTWDTTFNMALRDEALVREVARTRLRGECRLSDEEVLILRPVLGEVVERDVVGEVARTASRA